MNKAENVRTIPMHRREARKPSQTHSFYSVGTTVTPASQLPNTFSEKRKKIPQSLRNASFSVLVIYSCFSRTHTLSYGCLLCSDTLIRNPGVSKAQRKNFIYIFWVPRMATKQHYFSQLSSV